MSTETWVFDVDGCIIDSLTGTSLRPGTRDLLARLRDRGVALILWSAGGADYARQRAAEHGVADFFESFHDKDTRGADGRYETSHFLDDHAGVVFVDDRPEDMPGHADVIAVSPYLGPTPHDRGLERAAGRAEGTRSTAKEYPLF